MKNLTSKSLKQVRPSTCLNENLSERQLLLNALELSIKYGKDSKDSDEKFNDIIHWLKLYCLLPEYEKASPLN